MSYEVCLFRYNPEQLDYLEEQVVAQSPDEAARILWSSCKESTVHEISVTAVEISWWEDDDAELIPTIFRRISDSAEDTFPFRKLG